MTARDRQGSATTTSTDLAERARAIALNYLNHSPRSSAQVRAKLLARDVELHVADILIERYLEVGLLDDGALAKAIARTRRDERGLARRAIAAELHRKGFNPDHIADALAGISDQEEWDTAHHLAVKHWNRLEAHPHGVRERRVVAMLGRKGYSSRVAIAVVKRLQRADTEVD